MRGPNDNSLAEDTLLNYYDLKPLSTKNPQSIVIFLHGYGADGRDLISIGKSWQNDLPDTYFLSPDAPFPFEGGFSGKQWFSLRDMSPSAMIAGVQQAYAFLDTVLAQLKSAYAVPAHRIALVGFSQGAMVSLSYAFQHSEVFGGIISYSGSYVPQDEPLKSKPEVLLLHGAQDPILPLSYYASSKEHLEKLGVRVTGYIKDDLAHGIDEWGISLGSQFLKKKLYKGINSTEKENKNGSF